MTELKEEIRWYQGKQWFVLLLFLGACLQSPRSSIFPDKESADLSAGSAVKHQNPQTETLRFRDTSYQHLHSADANPVVEGFASAQADFDDHHYDAALHVCQQLMETLDDADSLNGEARFLLSECWIQKSQLPQATDALQNILKMKSAHGDLQERSLLRLGQVFCLQNKMEEAKQRFAEFKKNYPSSPFLKLAHCDATTR